MRPGDDDYEAQLEALRMLELERQAQVDAGAVGTNMPGAKVDFAPDSGMTPEASRVPIQPKVVDLTTQPKGNLERSKAMRADWDNRSSQALERAGRELVAGLTRTQVAPTSEWDTGHFARFVADQERAAQREGRATQAQLAGKKIDFDKAEAARKAAEDKSRDERDFAYRQKHDAEALDASRENSAANRSIAAAGLGIRQAQEARDAKKDAAGRDLPATEVSALSELPVAEKQVDDLAATFERLGMGGTGGKAASAVTDILNLQGTDAAEYKAAAMLAMQAAGKIVEGGKLAAGDEMKYRKMMPLPGDSPEAVQTKTAGMKAFLRDLASRRAKAFRESGFNVAPSLIPGAAEEMISVINLATGQRGKMPRSKFNPEKYEVVRE